MHTVESIKALALSGTTTGWYGQAVPGAVVSVGDARIVAQVDPADKAVTFYVGCNIVSEEWLARLLAEPWRQQGKVIAGNGGSIVG
jgi:hypothetical protein